MRATIALLQPLNGSCSTGTGLDIVTPNEKPINKPEDGTPSAQCNYGYSD